MECIKEQPLFEIETFCNILHAFTVTFEQFNAPLLNFLKHVVYMLYPY